MQARHNEFSVAQGFCRGAATVGLAAVSRMIGHSRIATTQEWYYHLLPGAMREAIAFKSAPLGSSEAKHKDTQEEPLLRKGD